MSVFKEILQELWKSKIGRFGLALLLILIGISLYVPFRYPSNFGKSVWSNPEHWADNPKSAPPFWLAWFGKDRAQHHVFEDSQTKAIYRFRAEVNPKALPSFLSLSLGNVSFGETSPVVEVYAEGKSSEVFLYRHVVPGKRIGETSPVARYKELPYRVNITSSKEADAKFKSFFSALAISGEQEYDIKVLVRLENDNDTIGTLKFVVGGDVYGWLGTDNVGRDLFQGILYGVPIALLIALPASLLANFLGATAGGISGYRGGLTDTFIQRLIDVISNIPLLPILIFLVFIFGPQLVFIVFALAFFGWTGLAIQLRPWVFQIRESGFVEYSKARGFSFARILFLHILPQTLPYLFANFIFFIPSAILAEAGLSFLGLGDPSLPTWGQILQQGFTTGAVYLGYWWWILPPGIAIVLTTVAFFLLSLSVERILEPRLRRGE